MLLYTIFIALEVSTCFFYRYEGRNVDPQGNDSQCYFKKTDVDSFPCDKD